MFRIHGWLIFAAVAGIFVAGCSKSDQPSEKPKVSQQNNAQPVVRTVETDNSSGPAVALHDFLEAVRRGDDEKASKMLSTTAQEKAASMNLAITPPASDTARFTIGKVELIGEDGARITSDWIDVDEDGQSRSDTAIWVLRREAAGWRVAGVATTIFPGEPPLLLNFEDPDDMQKKQKWVKDEIRRRAEAEVLQAKEAENSDNSLRR